MLLDGPNGWRGGVDLAAVGRLLDGMVLCCYNMQPEAIGAAIRDARIMLGAEAFLGLGLRLFYPEVDGPDILAARVKFAVEAGAEGVNFYNYGLVPAGRLDWVRAAVETLAPAH